MDGVPGLVGRSQVSRPCWAFLKRRASRNGGCECPWVRNQGGGVGQGPTPGDIRTQGHSYPPPHPLQMPAFNPGTAAGAIPLAGRSPRSERHKSEHPSIMSTSDAVLCLKKKKACESKTYITSHKQE